MDKKMDKCIWLFGCGASFACNLKWKVPENWKSKPREEQIRLIKNKLLLEMDNPKVDTNVYKKFLTILSQKTDPDWYHKFVTTNWDYLLQREILKKKYKFAPGWLRETHVSHLNGTVEVLENNTNRSPFLLQTDPASIRVPTVEADIIYNDMLWHRLFVVVGMSFECDIDKGLLRAINNAEDETPIGASEWIVVNPDKTALEKNLKNIKKALPRSKTTSVISTFEKWIKDGMIELKERGVLVECN